MKSKMRIIAVLLAVITVLALAPFAMAADGATIAVPHGGTKRFELYRKYNDQWNTIDKSYMYSDFSAVSSGDEKIARIVVQNGAFQVVGYSRGTTTYTATTTGGETFTGYITVISPAPAQDGNMGGGGYAFATPGDYTGISEGALFLPVGNKTFRVPTPQGAEAGGTWSSSDPEILDINPTTGVVDAKKPGQVTLTYTYGADNKTKTLTVYVSSNGYDYKVEYYSSQQSGHNPYLPGYTGVGSYNYGRVLIRYASGAAHDVAFSATGDIDVDSQSGYFYKKGGATGWGPGYGYSEWRGTIIMTSPTMGVKYVNVRLR